MLSLSEKKMLNQPKAKTVLFGDTHILSAQCLFRALTSSLKNLTVVLVRYKFTMTYPVILSLLSCMLCWQFQTNRI